jgi:hypothetical protein
LLIGDFQHEPPALPSAACANHRAKRPGNPALASDHLPDIFLGDMQAQNERILALDLFDPDGVRVVYELPGEIREQFSHG